MKLVETILVPSLDTSMRLQDFVPGVFTSISSKSGMKKAIKKGLVHINGIPGNTADFLKGGESLSLYQSEDDKPIVSLDLEVLMEDEYLAVLNKPAGLEVSGYRKYTLANALPSLLTPSNQVDALLRPLPVHRLDYPTTGVLLVAKTSTAATALGTQFESRSIQKTYFAVTIGTMPIAGTLTEPIDGKEAKTEYEVVRGLTSERFDRLNLVRLVPRTGRRHQLRKHLAGLGHPILGDKEYGKEGLIHYGNGLYLHAFELCFEHPVSKEGLCIQVQLPKKFRRLFS